MSKRILLVANVTKEHILKFHVPTIKAFKEHGWIVDVMSSGNEAVPFCDNKIDALWKRSPFNLDLFRGIKQLKNHLKTNHYDVIYAHTPVGGLVARLAAKGIRKNGIKVIYCAHGFHFYKNAPLLNWMIFYPVEKLLAKYTDSILLVNNEDYKLAEKKFSNRSNVMLVPEVGINIKRLDVNCKDSIRKQYREDLKIPDNAVVLIYVAELIKNKNQQMLIDVLKKVRRTYSNTYLLLVGPDNCDGLFQKKCEEEQMGEYVKLLGWRSDIGELLSSSDICVASSIREGFGLNIVEAMYCGLPIVATNNRGHSTIVEHKKNGFLVDVNNSDQMAEYVMEIIKNGVPYQLPEKEFLLKYDAESVANYLFELISSF